MYKEIVTILSRGAAGDRAYSFVRVPRRHSTSKLQPRHTQVVATPNITINH